MRGEPTSTCSRSNPVKIESHELLNDVIPAAVQHQSTAGPSDKSPLAGMLRSLLAPSNSQQGADLALSKADTATLSEAGSMMLTTNLTK